MRERQSSLDDTYIKAIKYKEICKELYSVHFVDRTFRISVYIFFCTDCYAQN